jgi:uncharacterized protein YndB with AHSA1/START domain
VLHPLSHAAVRPVVRVEHDYKAPPETIFDAWLDSTLVARWMAPGSIKGSAQIDPRTGGQYRVMHSAGGKPVGGFDARIIEIDRPRRLVFAWGFLGPNGERGFVGPDGKRGANLDSRLTITFKPLPSGTRLLLVHEELDDLAAALPDIAEQVEAGWEIVLEKMAGIVE